jgi:hypothetical protein
MDYLQQLPDTSIDISSMLHTIDMEPDPPLSTELEHTCGEDENENDITYSSSFMANLPNRQREIDIIKETLQISNANDTLIHWPELESSPINEYNTEALLDMAFPSLFPSGIALPMQSRYRQVKMHEYVLHLMRYHDSRFGSHPRFRYFVLNLMMRH